MSHAHKAEKLAHPKGEAAVPHAVPAHIKERVVAYWRRLGLTDPALIDSLAEDCLHRAKRRLGRRTDEALLMRTLEEAQRRFDHALARALRLPPSGDIHAIAAARAALLLSGDGLGSDCLFRPGEPPPEFQAQLQAALPRSTPPEAHLSMPEAPLSFWLFESPPRHR
jgi:hypothetical protein